MPTEDSLPPYAKAKADVDPVLAEQVSQTTTPTIQDDLDAQIVTLCHNDRSKPRGKDVLGECNEAVLLPSAMSRDELMRHLESRTVKLAKKLNLNDDNDEKRTYALVFSRGKGAEVRHVAVVDEENWQACRVLLRKHEDARLTFLVMVNFPREGSEGGKGGAASGGGDGTGRSGKKCVVQ